MKNNFDKDKVQKEIDLQVSVTKEFDKNRQQRYGRSEAATGGSATDIATAGSVASNAVENNLLSNKEIEIRNKILDKSQGKGFFSLDWGSMSHEEAMQYIYILEKYKYSNELLERYKQNPNNLTLAEKNALAYFVNEEAGGNPELAQHILFSKQRYSRWEPAGLNEALNKAKATVSYYNSTDYQLAKSTEPALYFMTGGLGTLIRGTAAVAGAGLVIKGGKQILDGEYQNGLVNVVNGVLLVAPYVGQKIIGKIDRPVTNILGKDDFIVLSSGIEKKILEGQRIGNSNRIIGGHSTYINNQNPRYAVELVGTNSDGTRVIKFTKQFKDSSLSKIKTSTIFPENWSNEHIINSIKMVGKTKPIGKRLSTGETLHRGSVNGIQIDVIKKGNNITAGYPVGNKPTQGFSPIK